MSIAGYFRQACSDLILNQRRVQNNRLFHRHEAHVHHFAPGPIHIAIVYTMTSDGRRSICTGLGLTQASEA